MFRPVLVATFVALALTAAPAAPPRDPVAKELRALANDHLGALKRGEIEKVADFAHPNIVNLVGGRENVIALVRGKLDQLKADGGALEKITVSEPSQILREKGRTFALVPMEIVVRMPEERITQKSCLLGIRNEPEPGQDPPEVTGWKFLDVGAVGDFMIKLVMPKLPEGLKLPPREEAVHEKLPPAPAKPDPTPARKKKA